MIHISKTELTLTKQMGMFHCPGCRQTRPFQLKSVREFLAIYFIPLIPLKEISEHVICRVCKDKFDVGVLRGDVADASPQPRRRLDSVRVSRGVILASLRLILCDGRTSRDELLEAQRLIHDRTGISASLDDIEDIRKLVMAPQSPNAAQWLQRIPDMSDVHLERAVRDLFLVASADGDLRPQQIEELVGLVNELQIRPAKFRQLIDQAIMVTETDK